MNNEYEIRGEVTAIFLNNRKYGRMETLIDTDDLLRVKELPYSWIANWDPRKKDFYVQGELLKCAGKKIRVRLHRWILSAPSDKEVDHINGITLDNRKKSNLRICSRSENQRNKRSNGNYSSKFKGVTWHKHSNKYIANIRLNNKRKYLGYFENEIEAAKAYNEAAKIMHGEFASLNEINEGDLMKI